ncbi:MAG: hypothetical protein CMN17_10065 [Roseovarius sp.]|nr:hypothetical protein [Roseovarius sp.]MBK45175.1 hypothetical protein [Roseovarius sp.]|tara:strand:+ start:1254 stop:1724 length:471 start_codon:yes stop_codon:yes gene_type:complete
MRPFNTRRSRPRAGGARPATALIATLLTALPFATPLAAQEAGRFTLELNNTEAVEGGCRLTFVAHNATGTALEQTSYDVAVFDETGAVSDRLILEFGRLTPDKTRVVQFLLNRGCGQVSRLLLNDAEDCVTADGTDSRICMDALEGSSRTDIAFGS